MSSWNALEGQHGSHPRSRVELDEYLRLDSRKRVLQQGDASQTGAEDNLFARGRAIMGEEQRNSVAAGLRLPTGLDDFILTLGRVPAACRMLSRICRWGTSGKSHRMDRIWEPYVTGLVQHRPEYLVTENEVTLAEAFALWNVVSSRTHR